MTLQTLAGAAGLSQPFLSQVERGRARLSMRSLDRVAQALGTSAVGLLGGGAPADADRRVSVVPRRRQPHLPMAEHMEGAEGHAVTEGGRHIQMVEFVGGSADFEPYFFVHRNEEMCFVIEGHFEFDVEGETYHVGPGETIAYGGGVPHRYRVVEGAPGRLLVTIINEDMTVSPAHT